MPCYHLLAMHVWPSLSTSTPAQCLLLMLSFESCLHISNMDFMSDMWFVNNFSQCTAHLSLTGSFTEWKFLDFDEVQCIKFFFDRLCFLCHVSEPFISHRSWRLTLMLSSINYIVLHLHLQSTFIYFFYNMWALSQGSFFNLWLFDCSNTMCWKITLSALNCFCTTVKKSVGLFVYFFPFGFSILFSLSLYLSSTKHIVMSTSNKF